MFCIQGPKNVWKSFVVQTILEIFANIFDTFLFEHTVILNQWKGRVHFKVSREGALWSQAWVETELRRYYLPGGLKEEGKICESLSSFSLQSSQDYTHTQ